MQMQNTLPICISGMSCVCAAGTNYATMLHNSSSLCAHTELHKNAMPYPFFAAPLEAFGGKRLFSARDTLNLAIFAAKSALQQANILQSDYKNQCGVALGTTAGSALHFLDGYANLRQSNDNFKQSPQTLPDDIEDFFHSNLALNIAEQYNLLGPSLTIANACTSGADAIGLGLDMLLQGQSNIMLCGGADALSLVPHTGFARLMIYSAEPCRPFDAGRKGLNLGEGAGMLVLEKTEHALARGVKPLGYIAGYGNYADAHHFTAPHPEARGLNKAVQKALDMAGITQEDLAFINAHGTATPENDKVEGRYFQNVLPNIPVWGSKSITGHTLGAAGAVEAIFSILALNEKILPKTQGFTEVDPEIGLTPTTKQLAIQKEFALSTSLGFGGSNAALVVKGVGHEQ